MQILNGFGFSLVENRVAIETVADIRSQQIQKLDDVHPLLTKNRGHGDDP